MPATPFTYVYILCSSRGEHHYVGCTRELQQRLRKHNRDDVSHTAKHRPWAIKTAIAFTEPDRARAFERYLKSPSGRAHLLKSGCKPCAPAEAKAGETTTDRASRRIVSLSFRTNLAFFP